MTHVEIPSFFHVSTTSIATFACKKSVWILRGRWWTWSGRENFVALVVEAQLKLYLAGMSHIQIKWASVKVYKAWHKYTWKHYWKALKPNLCAQEGSRTELLLLEAGGRWPEVSTWSCWKLAGTHFVIVWSPLDKAFSRMGVGDWRLSKSVSKIDL